jgi:DMSO reductase family type II enzyme heme b subunit
MNIVQTPALKCLSHSWVGMCAAVVWIPLATGCGRNTLPEPAAKTSQKASPETAAAGSSDEQEAKAAAEATAKTVAKQQQATVATDVPAPEQGARLYAQHCAGCHGEKGDAQGLAARFLFPKPRDFRAGRFRLISTANGVPTPADIEAVLVHGMPGSAMISWAHLDEGDRKLLASHVLELRRQGARDVELAAAKEADETLGEAELKESIDRVTTPGEVVAVPALGNATPEAIARGRELYQTKGCLSCHGKEGKGDGQEKMVDAEGMPDPPRDLTRGIYKGNADPASVYRRLWLGMPGSPMPSSSQNLKTEQVADLVHFVLSLSDEATRNATVMRRERLVAPLVSEAPSTIAADSWSHAPLTKLRLTPLWWRDEADPELTVQALHDGKALFLRLSWSDDTPDLHALKSEAFKDAAAVELYRGNAEPFVGMGGPGASVDVWMWDSDHDGPAADVEDANPRITVDRYPLSAASVDSAEYARPTTKTDAQPPAFLTARAAGNPIVPHGTGAGGSELEVSGPGSVTFALPVNQSVMAHGEWREGRWTVVMSRPLVAAQGSGGVNLAPGDRASAAFAVFNGSKRDRDGQKLITIWQDLVLEGSGTK